MICQSHDHPTISDLATFTLSFEDCPKPLKFEFSSNPGGYSRTTSQKRIRSTTDVDGEGSGDAQNKKRRLRLDFVTSRLSRPFAVPTTYIVSRGNSRVAKWARQGLSSQHLLRKAALINWTRIRDANRKKTRQMSITNYLLRGRALFSAASGFAEDETAINRFHKPFAQPYERPLPSPSPLGLSNYDAIDLEGDPYDDDDSTDSTEFPVNSDFSKRESLDDTFLDDYDAFPSPDSVETSFLPCVPSSTEIMALVTEEDKQQEVSFAQFGPTMESESLTGTISLLNPMAKSLRKSA